MPPPPRNFGEHVVEWDDSINMVTIYPLHPDATATKHFGLGNAVIVLNLSDLPEKIVSPITGETTKEGMAPTSPFGLKRWFAAPSNMNIRHEFLTGYDGFGRYVDFPQADGGAVKEVTSTNIIQNGFGSSKIYPSNRVEY